MGTFEQTDPIDQESPMGMLGPEKKEEVEEEE